MIRIRKKVRRYILTYWVGLIVAMMLNAFVLLPSNVQAPPIPGSKSIDMQLYKSGRIYPTYGSFACGRIYYYVYRSVYSYQNHWIGKVWSDKPCWFSDIVYHRTSIRVYNGILPGLPNCGNDPYCNLPVNGQTSRYNSGDYYTNGDVIGAKPTTKSEWVSLPWTSVPHGRWSTIFWYTNHPIYVHFQSGYGSCRNWDDMRVGVGSEDGHGSYMRFTVVYDDGQCWFGWMDGSGTKLVKLDRFL